MPELESDIPIKCPDDDKLDHNPLAITIAECVRSINESHGNVVAIHGPWGSGKSSLVGLILYNLEHSVSEDSENNLIIVPFDSWCYQSEKGIVAGFFQEICSRLPETNIETNIINNIVADFLKLKNSALAAAQLSDPVTSIAAFVIARSWLKKLCKNKRWYNRWCERFKKQKRDKDRNIRISKLQNNIGTNLINTNRRILIVIDEIDRLSPEEAIAIFRLIKSVGRIRNVMYLVSYDRKVTEKMIKKRYPYEGDHYLEKVVQASFEIPTQRSATLRAVLERKLNDISRGNSYEFADSKIGEVVLPRIQTLRDVHRLTNTLLITYHPDVEKDVDFVDFVSIETIRIFYPDIYNEIRSLKSILTDPAKYKSVDDEYVSMRIKKACKGSKVSHKRIMEGLNLIFPTMSIQGGPSVVQRYTNEWDQRKLVCSSLHFDTYFRFSVSKDIVSNRELQEFIRNASDRNFVESKFDIIKNPNSAYSDDKIALMLQEIEYNIKSLNSKDISPFLINLYTIVGEFPINSRMRVLRLTQSLIRIKRNEIDTSRTIGDICAIAPLDLRIHLCSWITTTNYTKVNKDSGERENYVENDIVDRIRSQTLPRVRSAFADDTILTYKRLLLILQSWKNITDNESEVSGMFRDMVNRSDDNLIKVVDDFNFVFQSGYKDDNLNRVIFNILNGLIDVEFFVKKLTNFVNNSDVKNGVNARAARNIAETLTPYVKESKDSPKS